MPQKISMSDHKIAILTIRDVAHRNLQFTFFVVSCRVFEIGTRRVLVELFRVLFVQLRVG
jgi:hypothetical protein